MRTRAWFRTYLLLIGGTILSLGILLLFRSIGQHRSLSGVILGVTFIVYGALRIRQRGKLPAPP